MNRVYPSRRPPFIGPDPGAEPKEHRIEASHDALPPGTRLAEYEILSVLGEGRFGIVYLAADHGLRRQVAIKEYFPAALAGRGAGMEVALRSDGHSEIFALGLESFIDEARLLARFDHPALVRVYRFWEANGSAYMVMPYYKGLTLGAARKAMPHPPDEAWLRDLMLPLLGALEVLHGAGCHHEDISPENIVLLADGRPVLLDFGAARQVIGDGTRALPSVLEPAFTPIELYAESPQLPQGPWSSLYALAAVAYYCVAGRPPVASTVRALDDRMEPLSQVVDRLGRSFPELTYSVAFVSAIERALSVRPQERPQSVAEFRRALLGGQGAAESPGGPSAVETTEPHGESPPLRSSRDETEPFRVFPNAWDGGNAHAASRERPEPWPPKREPRAEPAPRTAPVWEAGSPSAAPGPAGHERPDDADDAALRRALDAALGAAAGPDPDDFGASALPAGSPKAGGGRRTLFGAVAAMALVVLAAGGWMLWSDYRDGEPRSLALVAEPERHPSPLLPREPPATVQARPPAEPRPALPAGAVADAQLPPGTAAPGMRAEPYVRSTQVESSGPAPDQAQKEEDPPPAGASPGEPPPGKAPAAAAAPVEDPPPEPPAVEKKAPSPPPPAKLAEKEPDNPRVLCGPRTQFSLYRCMKQACERTKYYDHAECRYLRVMDAVRTAP